MGKTKEYKVESKYNEGDKVNITLKGNVDRESTILRVVALSSSKVLSYVVHTFPSNESTNGEAWMLLEAFEHCTRRYNRLHK